MKQNANEINILIGYFITKQGISSETMKFSEPHKQNETRKYSFTFIVGIKTVTSGTLSYKL